MSRAIAAGGGQSAAQVTTAIAAATLIAQAKTALAGVALTAGTPTLLSWAVPNDGNLHFFTIGGSVITTVATTGGAIQATFTTGGVAKTLALFTATKAVGVDYGGDGAAILLPAAITCDPGTTVSIVQSTGLTGGAAAFIGAIFGQ